MQETNGYVKLFRKFKKWGWYEDLVVKAVFLHCLLSASYGGFEWMGKKYGAGEFITSTKGMSKDLKLSVQQIRTALKKLELSGEISVNSTNKFTAIKVIKWANFQDYDHENNKQITNKWQTNNNQLTNEQQQYKNIKNNKNIKNIEKENPVSAWPNAPDLGEQYKKSLL